MHDREIRIMINRVIEEITMLRNENASLRPLADAYLSIRKILELMPEKSQGYGEDIVWLLKKELANLTDKEPINNV